MVPTKREELNDAQLSALERLEKLYINWISNPGFHNPPPGTQNINFISWLNEYFPGGFDRWMAVSNPGSSHISEPWFTRLAPFSPLFQKWYSDIRLMVINERILADAFEQWNRAINNMVDIDASEGAFSSECFGTPSNPTEKGRRGYYKRKSTWEYRYNTYPECRPANYQAHLDSFPNPPSVEDVDSDDNDDTGDDIGNGDDSNIAYPMLVEVYTTDNRKVYLELHENNTVTWRFTSE